MRITRVIVFVSLCIIIAGTAFAANPYCVAGYNVLTKLGMPAGSTDYDWNGLHTERPIQMCRPNHYYTYIGIAPRWWGYNQDTGVINDPAQFTTWVTNNPGKIWIIGNEPDIVPQDGLTVEQYVDMYYTYYTFIKPLDPTAKFCIGAMTGGSTAAALVSTKNWYQSILSRYKQKYGVTMPIDIWNVHSYIGPTQIDNPDKIINEYVNPFVNWCHTVENNAYAGCEVWITELPIGEWMGAVSEDLTIWFMQRYLPRLEQTGVTKWFWYVSSDWDGSQGSCALVRGGVVTPVGAAYAALANGYPNSIIPITPFVPDPTPGYFGCDFSNPIAMPWFNKAGYWKIDNGNLRHQGIYPWHGTSLCLSYIYVDSGVSFKMKINSAADPMNWGSVVLRTSSRYQTCFDSGYLVYVRQNGDLGLFNKFDSTVVSVPGAVATPGDWHDYRVSIIGYNIKVYVDDVLKIDWTDPNQRFASGYTLLQVHKSDTSYDDFMAISYPTPLPVVSDGGAYTYNTQSLPVSWIMPDTGASVVGFKYAVGTSPGSGNVLGWTSTTATSVDIPGSFSPGTTYYVSVKAVYAGGLESGIGSSDGIIPVVGAPNASDLKKLPLSSYALLEDVVVSGVFSDCVYIQGLDRSSGIRANGTNLGLAAGDIVSIAGYTGLSGKEAVLTSPRVFEKASGQAPKPLGMNNRSAGGSGAGLQAAVVDDAASNRLASGVSNVGLLVRTSGQVTYVDPTGLYAYIDDGSGINDGSGNKGIRMSLAGLPVPKVGADVVATACCGAVDVAGKCARYLRPRSRDDVWFSELGMIDNFLANSGFESGTLAPWNVVGSAGEVKSGNWYLGTGPHSGSWFYGVVGNYTVRPGVIYQSVDVSNGTYQASAWSEVLHGANEADAAMNRIGIDPTGGTDPSAASVVWSDWDIQELWYQCEWRGMFTPPVVVNGGRVTVFLEYLQQNNAGWHINCFDDVRLFGL